MKSPWILLAVLLMITSSYACSVDSISTNNNGYYPAGEEATIIVNTSGDCSNSNINIFTRDLFTMNEETIYDGTITSNEMKFTTKTNDATIQKIYASTYPKTTKRISNEIIKNETKSTPIITTIGSNNVYTYFAYSNGVLDPETYEYDIIDINLGVLNSHYSYYFDTNFGFYLKNNDFNIISVTGDFTSCTKLDGYPYSCMMDHNFAPRERLFFQVKISKIKFNDNIITFGKDGPVLLDQNKVVYSKPFITIKNTNVDGNLVTIDYNMYNYQDINYCKLIVNGNETKRSNITTLNNQFIQDLNKTKNIIDINCYTDNNHYSHASARYSDISNPPAPQPWVDNVEFSLDNNIIINLSDFVDGNGSLEDPFVVGDCSQLQLVNNYKTSYFSLNENIDCNGIEFTPITDFNGYFDGNGKIVYNLTINQPEENNVGLFSTLYGTITKIGLQDTNITGNQNVGGIAGTNNGKIQQTYVTGNINGSIYVGGIAGVNERTEVRDGFPYNGSSISGDILREINDSYSIANITGNNAGGITGYNKGKIFNVYAVGTINDNNTGGLVGINYTYCYDYTHSIKTGIINYSFSLIDPTSSNSCYSRWYRGSGALENGDTLYTLSNPDQSYLTDQNNAPFNRWDFENTWKMGDSNKKTLEIENYPILQWE